MEATAASERERWKPDLAQVRMEDLPASYREVAELIGLDAALALVAWRGGGKLAVPARPQPGHALEEQLGWEAWGRLCRTYRGVRIDVPSINVACRAARDRAIQADYWERRLPTALLAARYGLAERTIQVIVSAGMRVQNVIRP